MNKPSTGTGTVHPIPIELLPCPFCGGKLEKWQPSAWTDPLFYKVGCSNSQCLVGPSVSAQLDEAVRVWNERKFS